MGYSRMLMFAFLAGNGFGEASARLLMRMLMLMLMLRLARVSMFNKNRGSMLCVRWIASLFVVVRCCGFVG